jgi:hypothetical protein
MTQASTVSRVPYSSRASTSRPELSAPRGCPDENGGALVAARSAKFGSTGASSGANSPATITSSRKPSDTAPSGLRRSGTSSERDLFRGASTVAISVVVGSVIASWPSG